ncbi:hypothetical protein [Thermococcus sp.]|uniref:hypothetical protein n=1 Tax=Thermococcus sp. TaxID=35749 RepID=UPI0026205EE7|nr:hypothetical protein [Thermococcus sp.]
MESDVKIMHLVEYGELPAEEVPIEEVAEDAYRMLGRITVEEYETPRGRFLKLLDEYGNYIGKVLGCPLERVSLGSAYQTAFGLKVTLICGTEVVGWIYLEG